MIEFALIFAKEGKLIKNKTKIESNAAIFLNEKKKKKQNTKIKKEQRDIDRKRLLVRISQLGILDSYKLVIFRAICERLRRSLDSKKKKKRERGTK